MDTQVAMAKDKCSFVYDKNYLTVIIIKENIIVMNITNTEIYFLKVLTVLHSVAEITLGKNECW